MKIEVDPTCASDKFLSGHFLAAEIRKLNLTRSGSLAPCRIENTLALAQMRCVQEDSRARGSINGEILNIPLERRARRLKGERTFALYFHIARILSPSSLYRPGGIMQFNLYI